MGLPGPGIGGRGAISLEQGARLPTGDAHEVTLGAALGKPLVSESVAQLVRVKSRKADLGAAAAQHHTQARVGQSAVLTQHNHGRSAYLWRARARR